MPTKRLVLILASCAVVVLGGVGCGESGDSSPSSSPRNLCPAKYKALGSYDLGENAVVICAASQLDGGGKAQEPNFAIEAEERQTSASRGLATVRGEPLEPGDSVKVTGEVPVDAVLLFRLRRTDGEVVSAGFTSLPETVGANAEHEFFNLNIRQNGCPWIKRDDDSSSAEESCSEQPSMASMKGGALNSREMYGRPVSVKDAFRFAAERYSALEVAKIWFAADISGDWLNVCEHLGDNILKRMGGVEGCRSLIRARSDEAEPCRCTHTIVHLAGPYPYLRGDRVDVSSNVDPSDQRPDSWDLGLERDPERGWVIVDESG